MLTRALLLGWLFLLVGACLPGPRNPPAAPTAEADGCSKDTDCKGARICVERVCQNPQGAPAPPARTSANGNKAPSPPPSGSSSKEEGASGDVTEVVEGGSSPEDAALAALGEESASEREGRKPGKKASSVFAEGVEKLLLEKMNDLRVASGLKALKSEKHLLQAARDHSQEMAKLGYFSHRSPTPGKETFLDRIEASGAKGFTTGGENIIFRQGRMSDEEAADALFAQWLDSPPHKANILASEYRMTGLGIYRDGERVWGTQVFVDRVAR